MLGMATMMAGRGHDVVFLSNEYFRADVESAGLAFVPVGDAESHRLAHADPGIWQGSKSSLNTLAKLCWIPATERSFSYVTSQHQLGHKLAVIAIAADNGAYLAAEKLEIPKVLVQLSPHAMGPGSLPIRQGGRFDALVKLAYGFLFLTARIHNHARKRWWPATFFGTFLRRFREQNGLPIRYQNSNGSSNHFVICLFPAWFAKRASFWDSNTFLVGFPLFDKIDRDVRNAIDEFISLNGSPILFFSGSGVADVEVIFREGAKMCSLLNSSGIFVGGVNGKNFLRSNPQLLHVAYVDFQYVLPKCKAIVHHGGIGTVAQAIRAGIGQIIRPLSFDQPDNAFRIMNLGLGYYLPRQMFSAERVVPLVRELTSSATFASRIRGYSQRIERNDSLTRACNLIELHITPKTSSLILPDCSRSILDRCRENFIFALAKGGDGLACVALLLGHHNCVYSIAVLIASYEIVDAYIGVQQITAILSDNGLKARALHCPFEELSELGLPTILQWNTNHYVVLAAVESNNFVIFDPTTGCRRLNRADFEIQYCEIAIELEGLKTMQ